MDFIKAFLKLIKGIFGMTNNEAVKKIYDDAEEEVKKKHQEKLDIEAPRRKAIDQQRLALEKHIEEDKMQYKKELDDKSVKVNKKLDVLEKQLEEAMNSGDMDAVKRISSEIKRVAL